MQIVVTGAAGFVGSRVAEELADQGHQVRGIDCLLPDSYPAKVKRLRAEQVRARPGVQWSFADLRDADLGPLIAGADAIIHEAAMPGLVRSWSDFATYDSCNVLATQRLLRAAVDAGVGRFVQISTSSVYGRDAVGDESAPLRPFSPYGVTKLAAEHLVRAYAENFGLDALILRYFSIYGPGQRPDMGYHLFTEALLDDREITVFGDGRQTRSNTYVDDAVAATCAAVSVPGELSAHPPVALNIAGGEEIDVLGAIEILADELGVKPRVRHAPPRPGDQVSTAGTSGLAAEVLGWRPLVGVDEGLRRQARWQADRRTP